MCRDGDLGTRGPREQTQTGGQNGRRGREGRGGVTLPRAGFCSTGNAPRRWPHGGGPPPLDPGLFPALLRPLRPDPLERLPGARHALFRGSSGRLHVGCRSLAPFFEGLHLGEGLLCRRDVGAVANRGLRVERGGAGRNHRSVRSYDSFRGAGSETHTTSAVEAGTGAGLDQTCCCANTSWRRWCVSHIRACFLGCCWFSCGVRGGKSPS